VGATAAALVDLSTVAGNKISNPPWVKFQSAGWVNFPSAPTGQVNYDTHGDPYNAPRDFYHGYGKGRFTPEDKGVLEAAFDGKHGWFWRNRTDKPVTVTLRTEGEYIAIKRVI
jgi:hypothetical protein